MEYDPDYPPEPVTLIEIYWFYMNRAAELGMGIARSFGWKEKVMLQRCEAPGCMKEALGRSKFLDPRRGHGDELAYTVKHWCCEECQLAICDELERTAQYARLCN